MELITGNNNFFEKPFHPSVLRFCFLQAHYRSVLDISNEAMLASEKGFSRLMDAVKILDEIEASDVSTVNVQEWLDKAYSVLIDDFNSPILISYLFEAVKWIFLLKDGKETITAEDLALLKEKLNAFVFDVLGLQTITEETGSDKLDETLQLLIELRNQARKTKNWELSDQIRDRLLEKGIELKDGREGTSYTIN